jgi:hypothetical protein
VNPPPGTFEFQANERITSMNLQASEGEDIWPTGFTFTTDAGRSYSATPAALAPAGGFQPNGGTVNVGSGIIGRIRGAIASSGVMTALYIDMIDSLSSIDITDIDYSGFTNNIAPSGPGSTVITGSEILDNTNSSVAQTLSMTTSSAVTSTYTFSVAKDFTDGAGASLASEVDFPLVAKETLTLNTAWTLSKTTTKQNSTAVTTTLAATFPLTCPAFKFCEATAFFLEFSLNTNFNATFTATTTSGATFLWTQNGTYSGSDSLSTQLNVTEFSNNPA